MAPISHLDNHPLVRTQSIDEFGECLAKIYTEPKLVHASEAEPFTASINSYSFPHIALSFGGYSAAMRLEFPAVDQYLQLIPIRGTGEISCGSTTAIVTPDDCAIISPDRGYRASYTADREMLGLTIDAQALAAKLTALTGLHVNKPLRMDLQHVRSAPIARALREYIALIVDTINTADDPLPRWWIAQAEGIVMTMLLFGHAHSYSQLLEEWRPTHVAEWQVRRVEEYIEANWQQPVTLDTLAEVSGVSAIDLCSTFQKVRGCSPLEFAAWVRSKRGGRQQ